MLHRLQVVALAAAMLAAPGCCWTRADAPRSFGFVTASLADRTAADARATRETFAGIPAALARNWDRSLENLRTTSRLACGGE